jgi:DNA-binding transcriptional ArsR family regulator
MDALGDPTRRAIVERLLGGPMPVGELARDFPISRPAISQHLRILKKAHLVVDRPEGNRRLYALDPDGVDELRAYFDRFWTHALAAFKKAAEQRAHKEER